MTSAGTYDDFFAAVRQRESGGNYKVVNSAGYAGAYQFGEAALIDLGYAPKDSNVYDNKFTAGFLGKDGIDSLQTFLNTPAEQDVAAASWFSMLWSRIRASDLEFYAGQTLNGVLLTKSGMIAASHLAGTGGLKSFIQSGGVTNAKDSNQTSVVDYLKLFASYDTPATFLDNIDKNNVLKGGGGADIFVGGAGDDTIDGGAGVDTATYAGHRADALVQIKGGSISVSGTDIGHDTLTNIERLKFDDGTLAVDIGGIAGTAYRLYQAAFDRTPDTSGLTFWINKLDAGKTSLQAMADSFIHSAEFVQLYGTADTVSNTRYVELLYQNTLGRLPDSAGEAYWITQLDHGSENRTDLLSQFSESAENNARVAPAIQDGIWFA